MGYTKVIRRNIRRTPYQAFAATLIMVLTFLVVSIFLMLSLGLDKVLNFYESKPQAIAFFKDGTTREDVTAIENSLKTTGKVTEFKYISKEDALNIYREKNKDKPEVLELVTANILPASLEISAKEPSDLKDIAEIVKQEPVVEDVIFPEDLVSSLKRATDLIRVAGGAIVGFLITFATFIIILIIGFKMRIKREEIKIMQLLGASPWFIKTPYIGEGIFYGVAGAFLGWLISVAILLNLQTYLANQLNEAASTIFPVSYYFLVQLLLVEALIASIIGGLGSLVAVKRYLHI